MWCVVLFLMRWSFTPLASARLLSHHPCNMAPHAAETALSLVRTQDRDHSGKRTPRWRGITTLHEARAAGCQVVLASDNTRDQFYAYGDLDMLEVFTQVDTRARPVPADH